MKGASEQESQGRTFQAGRAASAMPAGRDWAYQGDRALVRPDSRRKRNEWQPHAGQRQEGEPCKEQGFHLKSSRMPFQSFKQGMTGPKL